MGQEHTYRYETKFEIVDYKEQYSINVPDPEAAQAWLKEQSAHMAQILKTVNDPDLEESFGPSIQSVDWSLDDERTDDQQRMGKNYKIWHTSSGTVSVVTDRELTEYEQGYLSEWIKEQAESGIGDEFAEQPFADYSYENDHSPHPDPYDIDLLASIETENNDFELALVSKPSLELTEADLAFAKQAAPQV